MSVATVGNFQASLTKDQASTKAVVDCLQKAFSGSLVCK